MSVTLFASGTTAQTSGGGESFISSPNVAGAYQLQLDLNLLASGDVIEIRGYKMVVTAGTTRCVWVMTIAGAQPTDGKIAFSDLIYNTLTDTNAVRFSITQTFGTTRALPYAVVNTEDTQLTGYSLGTNGLDSAALTAAAKNAIADSILDRNMATGTDSGTDSTAVRTVRQALRALRNKAAISGGTLTVYKEDDSSSSWSAAVSTASGDPITSVDPTN